MSVYVTSRSFELPDTPSDMSGLWFNVWRKQLWPYKELQPGDDLWWYETASGRLRWHSRVRRVEAFPYHVLDDAMGHLEQVFGTPIDRGQDYLRGKPDEGFCLAYEVKALKPVDAAKPEGLRFNRSGWERGERDGIADWLRSVS